MSAEIRPLLVEEIRKRLVALEAAPNDVEGALLTTVTLRGSAGLAGEPTFAAALARLEPRLRAGETATVQAVASLLRRVLTRLEDGESEPAAASWPIPPPDLEPGVVDAFVRGPYEAEMKDRLAGIDQCLASQDDAVETVRVAFRHVHTMKGAASAVGDEPTSWFCHGLEERLRDVSDLPSARAALIELGQYRGILGGFAEDPAGTLRKLRGEVEVSPRLSSRPAPSDEHADADRSGGGGGGGRVAGEAEDETVRVQTQMVASLLESIEGLSAIREKLEASSRRAREIARRTRSGAIGATFAEDLESLAGELRGEGDELGSSLIATKRLVSGLLLTTVGTVFARLSSAIEAEGRRSHREVRIRILGGDEPVDRRIAERLVDPCLQIARNAVAHGIEPPEVRRAVGKDAVGTITLSAKRVRAKLEVHITDDGAGVDLARVREHAIRTGFLASDRASGAEEAWLMSLLLRPGFSTQEAPDLLAGRGLGLDIALYGIQKLGGTMRVVNRRGQGFSVRIEVPVDAGSGLRLEPMTSADVPDAVAIVLENSSSADTRDLGTKRSAAITRFNEELARPWARTRLARAESGEVLSYLVIWHVADEVHVLDIATKSTARRRGAARALMNELVTFARGLPVRHLLLEVRRSNAPAIHLYRSLGFYATNVRKRYYDDGEDAIEMRLVLDEVTREVKVHPDEVSCESP